MIIAIVSAALVVALLLFAVVLCICRKRNISKYPHSFSKGNSSSVPWSAYAGCLENEATGTLPAHQYADGTLSGLASFRYAGAEESMKTGNPAMYVDGGHFYDAKSDFEIRPTEELMYEDSEYLRLVSLKNRQNERFAPPEPYATTPLISRFGEPFYPSYNVPNQFIPNIPHSAMNYTLANKNSICSNIPVLQFPPPPHSQGSSGSNNSRSNTSSGGSCMQNVFVEQNMPYHSSGDAPHHTSSPLFNSRHVILHSNFPHNHQPIYQVPTDSNYMLNPSNEDAGTNSTTEQKCYANVMHNQPYNKGQTQEPMNRTQSHMKDDVGSWMKHQSPESKVKQSSLYDYNKYNSPLSSAPGDLDESDDREESSCWSNGATHEIESSMGSISELNSSWAESRPPPPIKNLISTSAVASTDLPTLDYDTEAEVVPSLAAESLSSVPQIEKFSEYPPTENYHDVIKSPACDSYESESSLTTPVV